MDYVYLYGTLVVAVIWAVFYFLRPDLRQKLLLTSLLGLSLGWLEIFFVPDYWLPRFAVIRLNNEDLFLESFLFSFFLAGLAGLVYQIFFHKSRLPADRVSSHWLYLPPLLFFSHLFFPDLNVMFFSFGSMIVGAMVFWLIEPRLGWPMLFSGLMLFSFFTLMYLVFWQLFPRLVESYNYRVLSGWNIFGVPLEELLFFFGIGTNFCVLYEIVSRSRFRRLLSYFYR